MTPLLSDHRDAPFTLLEARHAIEKTAQKLNSLDIYHYPISVYVDKANPADPNTTPTDLAVYFSARERGRYTIKTGTEVGHADGSAFAQAQLRNLFGGAESLNVHVSKGTRTRSAFSAVFDTPLLSDPDLRWEIGGLVSSTMKPWASHEEVLKGGTTKVKYTTESGHRHELTYSGMWRQITGLASNASASVRTDAGDSFKSALTHTWINDKRDYPLLPNRGYLLKTITEIAGFGPLKGDVGFGKVEVESQAALPISIPGIEGDTGISFTTGFRGGILYPLTAGGGAIPLMSRVNDRFQLGGPADVRGFKFSGLGPHEAGDALGGDVYAAGGASLLLPFPRVGKDTPLRFQAFVNAGRLLALKGKPKEGPMDAEAVREGMKRTIQQLGDGLPSCAAGVGVIYAHPMARIEVNFSLPLVMRKGEEARKGLSLGIGIDFL